MTTPILPPASKPCGSCPYRRDVPSGVWDEEEYDKLPRYDEGMAEQSPGVFLCHRQDGRMCAGWVAVHDMEECLAFRIGCASGAITDPDVVLDYETEVPLFSTGAEAAAHGMKEIRCPGPEARRAIEKLKHEQENN